MNVSKEEVLEVLATEAQSEIFSLRYENTQLRLALSKMQEQGEAEEDEVPRD